MTSATSTPGDRAGARHHFLDTHLEVRGPAIRDLAAVFADDWHFSTTRAWRAPPRRRPPARRPWRSCQRPDQELNASAFAYFTGITLARERCFLTTPYFIPTSRRCARSSPRRTRVDVRLMVPARCDVRLVGAAPAVLPRLVHAVCTCSSTPVDAAREDARRRRRGRHHRLANVDIRSFRFNFELGAVVADAAVAAALGAPFPCGGGGRREWAAATSRARRCRGHVGRAAALSRCSDDFGGGSLQPDDPAAPV